MEKFYGTFEVAKVCHVSPGSVIRWIHEGKLASSLTAGGHHRVHAKDLLSLLEMLRMPVPEELKGEGPAQVANPCTPAGIKLLIIDDEHWIRQLIRTVVAKEFPQVQVEDADEGFVAGWKACGMKPDLVILDLMLPGLNGFHICELLRSTPELRQARIIAITGLHEPEIQEKILKIGGIVAFGLWAGFLRF